MTNRSCGFICFAIEAISSITSSTIPDFATYAFLISKLIAHHEKQNFKHKKLIILLHRHCHRLLVLSFRFMQYRIISLLLFVKHSLHWITLVTFSVASFDQKLNFIHPLVCIAMYKSYITKSTSDRKVMISVGCIN